MTENGDKLAQAEGAQAGAVVSVRENKLSKVLFMMAHCGFWRESTVCCALSRELWTNAQHLQEILSKKHGPENETRYQLCLKSESTNDFLAAARLRLFKSLGGFDRATSELQDRRNALHYAVANGLVECVGELLSWPEVADPNQFDTSLGWTPLIEALVAGSTPVVLALLDCPSVDVFKASKQGKSPLMYASGRGSVRCVQKLLDRMAAEKTTEEMRDLLNQFCSGKTCLVRACLKGNHAIVRLLLEQPYNIDVNLKDAFDRNALICACSQGHIKVVKVLISHPSFSLSLQDNINCADKFGRTALICAIVGGHAEVVEALLQVPGISVNQADNIGWTALIYAVSIGLRTAETTSAQALDVPPSSAQAPVAEPNQPFSLLHEETHLVGFSPSTQATVKASKSEAELVESQQKILCMILEFPGVDINRGDNRGASALFYACGQQGSIHIVEQILALDRKQSQIESWDTHSVSSSPPKRPFWSETLRRLGFFSCSSSHSEDRNHFLSRRSGSNQSLQSVSTDPSIKADANTPSSSLKSIPTPKLDVNHLTKSHHSALHVAADAGRADICRLLCSMPSIKVNQSDKNGCTALMSAILQDRLEAAEVILQHHDTDVNASSNRGRYAGTPLMVACMKSESKVQVEMVKLLLSHPDVDVNLRNPMGITARVFAKNNAEILQLMDSANKK